MWRVVSTLLVVRDAWPHWLLTVHQRRVHHWSRVAHEDIPSDRIIEVVRCRYSHGKNSTVASPLANRLRHNSDRSCLGSFWRGHVWLFLHFGEGRLRCGRLLLPLNLLQDFLFHLFLERHFLGVLNNNGDLSTLNDALNTARILTQ